MLRVRVVRLFTTSPPPDPRLDLLRGTAVPPEQVVFKPGKKVQTDRLKTRFEERFQDMKDLFGEDYKTPSEKYDLHFPRVQATGEKDFHERYNEKQGFWKGKILLWGLVGVFLCGTGFVYLKFRWDVSSQLERREQEKQEILFMRHNQYGVSNAVRNQRLAEIQQLKDEFKRKYGVDVDDKSLR